jgi:hypothetical protein
MVCQGRTKLPSSKLFHAFSLPSSVILPHKCWGVALVDPWDGSGMDKRDSIALSVPHGADFKVSLFIQYQTVHKTVLRLHKSCCR